MRRALFLLLLAAGCRTWQVNAFGVPLDGEPRHVSAAAFDEDLTTEEKLGVLLIVGVAIAVPIAIAVAAD